ncbi:MAG TPA: metallophosphoesterase, partial [Aggregatilineaceae bacterium]|nr:metallophosphoesterase [Aggregatilineaceae bacterium]
RAAPDLIVLTGDFVTSDPDRYAPDLIQPLRKLAAPAFAVLGNHDYWTDAPTVRGILAEAGVCEIGNAVHSIRRGAAALHVVGVDDIWEQQDRLDMVLDQLRDDDHAAILLAHEPDYAVTSAATGRFDLQLSGHSHAGQMIIPGKGPVFLPWLAQHYPAGQYQIGTMIQYTNRGVGMIAPHVRYNCRPEISLFTIRPTAH